MKKNFHITQILIFLCIISIFCIFPLAGHAGSGNNADLIKKQSPAVQKIGPDEYKVGSLVINKKKREMYISGSVNMQAGLVEYLACTQAEAGKLHESVLKLEANPSDIQVALLLLGFQPKNNLKFQGDPTIPEGDFLEIWVEWELANRKKNKIRGEELVYDQNMKKSMDKTPWVFTGSQIMDGRFMADIEGSIIATFRDPFALINNPLPSGADDTIYVCNEKVVPSQGTKILLTITAAKMVKQKGHLPA